MKRVFKYGFFLGIDAVCPQRGRQYPELAVIRDATPEERRAMDTQDLADAEHQWAYTTRPEVMQRCFEAGCDAVRPVPLHAYPERDQMFIMQEFMRRNLRDI